MTLLETTDLPLTEGLTTVKDIPHSISFVLRKVAQIRSFDELPKDKRPPEYMWDYPEKLDDWFDKVYGRKEKKPDELVVFIPDDELEG